MTIGEILYVILVALFGLVGVGAGVVVGSVTLMAVSGLAAVVMILFGLLYEGWKYK